MLLSWIWHSTNQSVKKLLLFIAKFRIQMIYLLIVTQCFMAFIMFLWWTNLLTKSAVIKTAFQQFLLGKWFLISIWSPFFFLFNAQSSNNRQKKATASVVVAIFESKFTFYSTRKNFIGRQLRFSHRAPFFNDFYSAHTQSIKCHLLDVGYHFAILSLIHNL